MSPNGVVAAETVTRRVTGGRTLGTVSRFPPSWLTPLRAEARFTWRVVVRHPWTRAAAVWGIGLAALARLLGEVPAGGGGGGGGWQAAAAIGAVVGVAAGCRVMAPGPARAALRWSVERRGPAAAGRALAVTGFLAVVATALALLLVGGRPPAFLRAVAVGTAVGAAAAAPTAALSARFGSTLAASVGLALVLLAYAAAPLGALLRSAGGAAAPPGVGGAAAVLLVAALTGVALAVVGRGGRRTRP